MCHPTPLEIWTFVVSVITCLAIVWYGWSALGQLKQMQQATKAATIAANAAQAQVVAAQENTQLEQRAWVGISAVRLLPNPLEPGKPITVEVGLRNTGRTPAINLVINGVVEPTEPGTLPSFTYRKQEDVNLGILTPTPAGHYFDVSYSLIATRSLSTGEERPATPEVIERLQTGKIALYAHGRVSYTDIFGGGHWITYCFLFHRDQVPGSDFVAVPGHNDMGDNS